MADQDGFPIHVLPERQATMRQPSDVLRRPAQQRSFRGNQASIQGGTYRFDKSEHNAFRGLWPKELMVCGIDEISNEKSAAPPPLGRATRKKPVPVQRPAHLKNHAI